MNSSIKTQALLKKKILETALKLNEKKIKEFSKKDKVVWDKLMKATKPDSCFLLSNPQHVQLVTRAISLQSPIIYHFGNFIAIASNPKKEAVEYVNFTKGRNKNKTGSITTIKKYLPELFDWSKAPKELSKKEFLAFVDDLGNIGPFGIRGPAAKDIPKHLSSAKDGLRTVQIILPGWKCPSNNLVEKVLKTIGEKFLYATSPNLSHHLTGKKEESAHYKIKEMQKDFAHTPGYFIIAQENEELIQQNYPHHQPTSTSIIGFDQIRKNKNGKISLTLERHGSLHVQDIRKIAQKHGFEIIKSETAIKRLLKKRYKQ